MKKARSFLAVAAVGLALLSGFGAKAYAVTKLPTTGQGNGLKISPVRTDLTIDKGGSRQVSMWVENVTAFPMTIQAIVNDFVPANDESGEPRVILDPKQSAPDHSFKTLVGNVPNVTIQPNERREIRTTLSVPKDAASGGYYGAIRFIPATTDTSKNVALTASVGSLYLITVPGQITQQLKVESFDVSNGSNAGGLFNSGPVTVITRFRNSGNIHVSPFGKVQIKDFSGHVVASFEINNTQPRGSVLPNSVRRFENSKDDSGQQLLKNIKFGRFTAEGSFGYGDNGDLILAKKTFYIIPYKWIAGVILLLAFVIFVLPRLIRAYNQSIIRRSQGASTPARGTKPKAKPRSKPKK